jgi:hypothetical protein
LRVKKKIEILSKPTTINFDIETPEEVATGTNFDIKIKFDDVYSEKENLWVGVALTDERVLLKYQPIEPRSTFNRPTSTVEVFTLGSKLIERVIRPQPDMFVQEMAIRGMEGAPGAGIRRMIRPRLRKRDRKLKHVGFEADIEQIDEDLTLYSLGFDSPADKMIAPPVQQVIRTEFPEDVVLLPEKAEGDRNIEIMSPDSITRYKIFVLACTENYFGVKERSIVVKNPIFTTTLNPPEMTLGDRISLPTVIENLSNNKLKDISITANSNQNLTVHNDLIQKLKEIKPKQKVNVYWDIEASKVGDVELSTLLESTTFSEYSELQKPLYVSPPGIPHPELFRSKLKANKPWVQEVDVTGEEAFTLGIVNFLPGLELASIEGVESLASYPYGCCEQTSATTIPNAIAYRYLESNNKLTNDIKKTLITNMQAGLDRYTSQFLNEKDHLSTFLKKSLMELEFFYLPNRIKRDFTNPQKVYTRIFQLH